MLNYLLRCTITIIQAIEYNTHIFLFSLLLSFLCFVSMA